MAKPERRPIKVFLACSGLGNVRRGYEAFMRECYEFLRRDPRLDVWLFKGAGPERRKDRTLANLGRNGFGARVLSEMSGRGTYVVEQVTFAASLLPYLARERPDLVYFCDPTVGKCLWYWRRMVGAPFRLVMHNGGPHPPPIRWCDHVHQLTPWAARAAIEAGQDPLRQTVIPCGIDVDPSFQPPDLAERALLRTTLGLPTDRPVILSVGALNRGHKRMDYLISEVANLAEPRPFVVMVGEPETETPQVRATAELLLGPDGFALRTVPHEIMDRYYRAADLFVLASLNEAFGLGYVEALARGLRCIAHDYPVSRFVLGGEGLADLEHPGGLTAALRDALATPDGPGSQWRRHRTVAERFGWANLVERYVTMIEHTARPRARPLRQAPAVPIQVEAEVSANP